MFFPYFVCFQNSRNLRIPLRPPVIKLHPSFPCSPFQMCKHSLGYPMEDLRIMSWNQLSSFIPRVIFSPVNYSMTVRQDFKNKLLIPCPCNPPTQIKQVTTKKCAALPTQREFKFEIEIMALACSQQATLPRCHMWHAHLVWGISPYSGTEASEIYQPVRQKVVNLDTSFQ